MRRLGMLLGLVLFMTASPALAAHYSVEVHDKSSYETRKFHPPGNVRFEVPLPKSKWICFLGKEIVKKDGAVNRFLNCESPGGYEIAVVCPLSKAIPVYISNIVLWAPGEKHKGYTVMVSCER